MVAWAALSSVLLDCLHYYRQSTLTESFMSPHAPAGVIATAANTAAAKRSMDGKRARVGWGESQNTPAALVGEVDRAPAEQKFGRRRHNSHELRRHRSSHYYLNF